MLRNQSTEAHHVAAPERSLTATRIREAREFTGLSKEQFARTCGTTRRNLIRWEYDQHQPTHRSLHLIADAAGVSVDWLIGATEELVPCASSRTHGNARAAATSRRPTESQRPSGKGKDSSVRKRVYHRRPLRERIQERIAITVEGCWQWQGSISPAGYGRIKIGERDNRYAHRISYEAFVGAIPEGLSLDHLCRNRACVNPEHLEPVTIGENIRRGHAARKAA